MSKDSTGFSLSQLQKMKTSDSISLNSFLEELPQTILRQYEYEDTSVRAGHHLMHSDYFKVNILKLK